ncbi:hypothetical protein QBC36DRAFT_329025 [Triangularia setosa]|uniref:Uncharacterized protein n=1 Tax=Triangularia setosa TaxID=2587417 RepID=A0AAN6W729_9PEZI|nr:hypothetical protein QBC36DRAFT_329025 [Podospora setosa]
MVGVSHCGLSSRLGGHTGGWWSLSGAQKPYNEYSIFDFKQQQQQHPQEGGGITIIRIETPFARARRALPLLLISVLAYQVWCSDDAVPVARDWLRMGRIVFEEKGREDVEIVKRFYGWGWLDELLALPNVFFLPAVYNLRPLAQEQLVSFLAEAGVVLFIMWYESVKNGQRTWGQSHRWFSSVMPVLFTLTGQLVSLGVTLPVYLFLSHVFPQETHTETTRVRKHELVAILLAIAVGYYVPTAGMFFDSMERRQRWLFVWQLHPFCVAMVFHTLSAMLPKIWRSHERNGTSWELRASIGLVAAASCLVRGWQVVYSQRGIADVFWPSMLPGERLPDFAAFCGELLKWDQLFVFGAVILWLAYSLGDVREYDEMTRLNWGWTTVGVFAASWIGGPGLAATLMWLAKQEAILS